MALRFLRSGDVLLLRYHPLYFLDAAAEIIIQAYYLLNQLIPVGRKPLNSHKVFNIKS
jgi:hypothetical protein